MVVRGDVMINASSVYPSNVQVGYSVNSNAGTIIGIEWILVDAEISLVEDLTPSDIQSFDRLLDSAHADNREKSCLSLLLKIMDDICFHNTIFTSFTYKLYDEIYI